MIQKYSVAMSVYKNDTVSIFSQAIMSVIEQTVPPNEIVLVRDGCVSSELQAFIEQLILDYNELITYVPLEVNGGLGNAMKLGIETAKYDLVARMDSDDICIPDRFERQLCFFSQNCDIDIVGGQVAEFNEDISGTNGKRYVPLSHDEIVRFCRTRSPMNHPTVMFRKQAVLDSGNYMDLHFLEDYYLWCRMLMHGCRFANLPDILVYMRVDRDLYKRRGGMKYLRSFRLLEKYKLNMKMINRITYWKNLAVRSVQCVCVPNSVRGVLYKFVRK